LNLKTTLRNTMLTSIATALTATSRMLIYTGSAPANTATPTGTLLGTFTLAATPGTASGGVLTFTLPSNVTGAASGTPGYGRMIDGTTDDGTHTQVQFSCGVGSGEMNFSSTIASGGTVSITAMTITDGNP
jgi:hypothetical protein